MKKLFQSFICRGNRWRSVATSVIETNQLHKEAARHPGQIISSSSLIRAARLFQRIKQPLLRLLDDVVSPYFWLIRRLGNKLRHHNLRLRYSRFFKIYQKGNVLKNYLRGALILILTGLSTLSQAEPRRIVSLNPCLDATLVQLADKDQIAALSHYARDPSASTIAEMAATLPVTSDNAEEIIALQPDLILSTGHSSLATRKALHRVGMKSELFAVPNNVAENISQIRRIAVLVGHPERGEALVQKIEAAINAARPSPHKPVYQAIVLQPSGLVAGPETLVGELMTIAGFENVADRYGIRQWGTIDHESLLNHPPQILLAENMTTKRPRWADRILSHPVLNKTETGLVLADYPQTFLFCGGPVLVPAIAAMAKARHRMENSP